MLSGAAPRLAGRLRGSLTGRSVLFRGAFYVAYLGLVTASLAGLA